MSYEKKLFSISLKMRTILNFLFSMVVIEIFAFYQINSEINRQISTTADRILSSTKRVSQAIESQFYNRYSDSLAFSYAINMETPKEKKILHLNNLIDTYNFYDLIAVFDTQGNLVAINDVSPDGKKIDPSSAYLKNYKDFDWFKNPLEKKFTEDLSKGMNDVYVTETGVQSLVEDIYKEKRLNTVFSSTIYGENDSIVGVIVLFANFSWLTDEIERTNGSLATQLREDLEYFILDGKGNLITFFSESKQVIHKNFDISLKKNLIQDGIEGAKKVIMGESGVYEQKIGKDDVTYFIAYSPIKGEKIIDELGYNLVVKANEDRLLKADFEKRNQFIIFNIVFFLCFVILGWYLGHSLSNSFSKNADKLQNTMVSLISSNDKLAEITTQLTHASSSQAAAVSETSAALSQMSSLANQTLNNCKEATELSQKAVEKADDGRASMEKMSAAMEAIAHENERLQDITQIISEITNKTAVINDIVFKTRLLSFNASIEAARAGVHGRGFAVVAEEVGNLAQMSGEAAKEIQQLLSNSSRQVSETLSSISERVKVGGDFSNEALRKFKEISQDILTVGNSSQNITNATQEQVMGIEQSYTAMKSFEENTRNITRSVDEIEKASKVMTKENKLLRMVYSGFSELVYGQAKDPITEIELSETGDDVAFLTQDVEPVKPVNGNSHIREKFKNMFKDKV